ncbi:hypothetical protein ACFXTI_029219 [Malus domestica]
MRVSLVYLNIFPRLLLPLFDETVSLNQMDRNTRIIAFRTISRQKKNNFLASLMSRSESLLLLLFDETVSLNQMDISFRIF